MAGVLAEIVCLSDWQVADNRQRIEIELNEQTEQSLSIAGLAPSSQSDDIRDQAYDKKILAPKANHSESIQEEILQELPGKRDDSGRIFLEWLQQGIANKEIAVNQSGSPVFVLAGGVLLVSPAIFKLYSTEWQHVRKRFLKLKLHRKAGSESHDFSYRDTRKPSVTIRGLLITNVRLAFGNQQT